MQLSLTVVLVTGLLAPPAGFGAAFTMFMAVHAAFFRAKATGFLANAEVLVGHLGIAQQELCSQEAYFGAVTVEFNAMGHWRNIALLQASRHALLTGLGAFQKGVDEVGVRVSGVMMGGILRIHMQTFCNKTAKRTPAIQVFR